MSEESESESALHGFWEMPVLFGVQNHLKEEETFHMEMLTEEN